MTENKILIYAGTTEGRRLAEFLVKREVSVHVCVATEYGESLLPEGSNITTTHERMDENQMIEFINEYHPSYVVDATHPYAIEVTENLQNACEKAGVPYLRILRDTGAEKSDCIYVDSMEEAIEYLEQTTEIFWQRQEVKNWQLFRISQITKNVFMRECFQQRKWHISVNSLGLLERI